MFRGVLSFLLLGFVASSAPAAEPPGEFYINRTAVANQMVNHRHFINEGDFSAAGSIPWDGTSILTFTNRNLMFGAPGFRFETVDPVFGIRTPAQVFYNSPNGNIRASDSAVIVVPGAGAIFGSASASQLKVNALNITNRGVMAVGANGFIQVHGNNIDLTGGALIVGDLFDPLSGGAGGDGFPIPGRTNEFNPSPAVYDLGWGIGANTNAQVQGVLNSVNPTDIGTMPPGNTPATTNAFGGVSRGGFRLDNALTWVREEIIDETNEVVQVIAVQTSDPSIGVLAGFIPTTFPDGEPPLGGFQTAVIELQVPATDFATLARVTNSLYVLDQLGAHTNRDMILNVRDGTFRPGNFIVHRDTPGQYPVQPATTNIRADLFTVHLASAGTNIDQKDYVLTTVSNEWSTYPFEVESSPIRLPDVPGVALTNLGGQVELKAKELRLANTRIRGEGIVTLIADNVTTLLSNVVDTPRITVNFATTTNLLTVNEFLPDRVERFQGTAWAYSAIFTNFYELYVTNAPADPADTNIVIVTNNVEVRFQMTLLDARGLVTQVDTVVEDLRLTSVNERGAIVFNEDLDVRNMVELNANEITFSVGSRLATFPGVGFSFTNLHNISVITNLGTLEISELADLRRSEFQPYARFVNAGDLSAYGLEIWADYFENTGTITATGLGQIDIRASTMRLEGTFDTLADIRLTGDVVKINNWQAFAGGRLYFDVSQTITDTGAAGTNEILVLSGFEMSPRRPAGDLLGTFITSVAGTFDIVDHTWGAEDRGASAGAFANNLALGGLLLEGGVNSVFQFFQARENSALYVDVLVLSGTLAESLAAVTNRIGLGMNIYYADLVSTNPAISAASVNRIFGPNAPFNLIWVPDFAGPNSSVDVPLSANGPVSRMNRGLRESLLVDSDGDGIPNGRDAFPLSATGGNQQRDVQLVGVSHPRASRSFSFSVAGPQAATYIIERTANLAAPDWQPVAGVLTNDPATSLKSFTDTIDQGSKEGYYRVRIAP